MIWYAHLYLHVLLHSNESDDISWNLLVYWTLEIKLVQLNKNSHKKSTAKE